MWSRQASLDLRGIAFLRSRKSPAKNPENAGAAGCGASLLGVGHFTVPPDVIEGPDHPPSATSRQRVVVHDPHNRCPSRHQRSAAAFADQGAETHAVASSSPEVHDVVERGGSREWFTDRLFVESRQANLPAACSTSAMVHVALVILVVSRCWPRGRAR